MIKKQAISVNDLMSKISMIIIKSIQIVIKSIFNEKNYKISPNEKKPPERKISMLKFG